MPLQHVNFHTWRNRPVFAQPEFDGMMRRCLPDVLGSRGVLCLAWEIMPTHVHLVVADFPDFSLPAIMKHVKGDTSRAFFACFPDLRADLGDGHLWRKGYYAAAISSHRQYLATVSYVKSNLAAAGLAPPTSLTAADDRDSAAW